VHVIYNTNVQNISDAQVISQINILNKDFARNNTDMINTPPAFKSFASATNFQFCLAKFDPSGQPTNGIERRNTNVTVFQPLSDDEKFYSRGGLDAWDVTRYL